MSETYNSRLFVKDGAPWTSGTGPPEGVVVADIGARYTDKNTAPTVTLYKKISGSGTSAGWVLQ